MIIIGHRGACGFEPENTLASFEKAIELQVDMIEFDVYVCATGEVVIIHDSTVDRTTNGSGLVGEKSLAELKDLEINMLDALKQPANKLCCIQEFITPGTKNTVPLYASHQLRIPTLEEALDLINRRTQVNIELKGPGTARPVAEIIKKYIEVKNWTYEDFLVSSFNHFELKEIKELLPEVRIAPLLFCLPLDYAACGTQLNAYSIHVNYELATKEMIEDAHARGLKIFAYVVDDEKDRDRLQKLGIDGIFTDYPRR